MQPAGEVVALTQFPKKEICNTKAKKAVRDFQFKSTASGF